MLKQTILHIGLEKTGTTSLQFLFRENRERLLQSKFLVSESSASGNNYHLAIASYSTFRADGLTRQLGINNQGELDRFRKNAFSKLAAEIAETKPETVLLSSEHFQSRLTSIADLELLKTSLEAAGCTNFKVLVYLRDPLKIAMSHHGMAIKKGVHVTADFYRPEHKRISHIINSQQTLANWSQVFGADRVEPRLYPEGQSSDVLIGDFLAACGLSGEQLDLGKQEVRNVNLSAAALRTLNSMNGESNRIAKLAEDRWLFNRLEQVHPGRGLTPSTETIALFEQHFATAHAQIADNWFAGRQPLFASSWRPEESLSAAEQQRVEASIRRLVQRAEARKRWLLPVRAVRAILGLVARRSA